tara:strand:- start:3244 stop:4437 length:1194 start_codon:yes stop_codon:yes gene_type:complete
MKRNFNKIWKSFLKEGIVKYDKKVVDYLSYLYDEFKNMDSADLQKALDSGQYSNIYYSEEIVIPYRELLGEDQYRQEIAHGFILFHYLHVSKMDRDEVNKLLEKNWDNEYDMFSDEFERSFFENEVYRFTYDIKKPDPGNTNVAYKSLNNGNFTITSLYDNSGIFSTQSIMKHEIRHLFQQLYTLAIKYNQLIDDANAKFEQIQKLTDDEIIKLDRVYGVGKKSKKSNYEDDFLAYLDEPTEFEPHIGDIADMYVEYLLREYIDQDQLAVARLKRDFESIFHLRYFLRPRVQDKNLYSKIINSYLKDPSIEELSSYWVSKLVNDEEFRTQFMFNAADMKKHDWLDTSFVLDIPYQFEVFSKRLKEFSDKLRSEIETLLAERAENISEFLERVQNENS